MNPVCIKRALLSDINWVVSFMSKYRRFFGCEDDDGRLYAALSLV